MRLIIFYLKIKRPWYLVKCWGLSYFWRRVIKVKFLIGRIFKEVLLLGVGVWWFFESRPLFEGRGEFLTFDGSLKDKIYHFRKIVDKFLRPQLVGIFHGGFYDQRHFLNITTIFKLESTFKRSRSRVWIFDRTHFFSIKPFLLFFFLPRALLNFFFAEVLFINQNQDQQHFQKR